jgi:uncharacterized membrane protein YbhN (UPF0104 family)
VILVAVGAVTSAAGLLFTFARVGWEEGRLTVAARLTLVELGRALAAAEWGWLALAAGLQLVPLLGRALELRGLARRRDGAPASLRACWHASAIGSAAQAVLPARLGEPARVVALARAGDVRLPEATTAILLGRVLDLPALVLATAVPALVFGFERVGGTHLRPLVGASLAATAATLGALALLHRGRHRLRRLAHRIGPRTARVAEGVTEGIAVLASWRRVGAASLGALAVPLAATASFAAALVAFDLEALPRGTSFLLCAATFLAIAIPSAPSGVGVYHAAATMLLTTLGAPRPAATAFAVATHLVGLVVNLAAGVPSLLALRSPTVHAAAR